MNLERLEQLCIRFAVISLIAFGLVGTVGMADAFLDWDLLEPPTQKVAAFCIAWLAMVFGGSSALALLLGHRRIADALGQARTGERPETADRARASSS